MSVMDRFEIVREIGRGAQGVTFLARDCESGQEVALKKLSLKDSADWNVVELFERESRALQKLDHAGIPKYIDAFHLDGDGYSEESFILVQEYVAGPNLAELIAQGLRMSGAQTLEFLQEMLEILKYLHALDPPVIHRDIKPSNIIRRLDGRWTLIDFGAVQSDVLVEGTMQELITVGTTGYMPFEQILGRAVPASDLYALGATAVHVLSHRHPNDLPVDDAAYMKLLFKPHITTTSQICNLLENLLEPLVENRIQTAEQALAMIAGNQLVLPKSANSRAKALVTANGPMSGVIRTRAKDVSFRLKRRGTAFGKRGPIRRIVGIFFGFIFVLHALGRMMQEGLLTDVIFWGQVFVLVVYILFNLSRLPGLRLRVTKGWMHVSLPLFWLWKRRILLGDVSDVRVVPYRTLLRGTRGYMVEIVTNRGDVFGYGTGQMLEESEWLAGEIREAIGRFLESGLVVGEGALV